LEENIADRTQQMEQVSLTKVNSRWVCVQYLTIASVMHSRQPTDDGCSLLGKLPLDTCNMKLISGQGRSLCHLLTQLWTPISCVM